ncbi:hypothetical protein RT761_00261 [Atribacter laminatus]|jgi:hypothetical protein|uniref:Uncharacterized protein n=1 Tax=Atribacter laminatus TaxID=2847778 RepID=A0A7T1F1K9_ATRLM|nr:hypothetical protein RT761_00261 [Atribacter laminatus]
MRSSRPQIARAQDVGLKNSFDGIFRKDPMPLIFNQTKMKNIYSRIDNSHLFLAKREEKRGEILFYQGERKRSKVLSHRRRGRTSPPLFAQTMDVKSAK